jgi:hypothetical protein
MTRLLWTLLLSARLFCGVLFVFLIQPTQTFAAAMDEEIDYLISSVGTGGCSFLRNGKRMRGREVSVLSQ